MRHCERERTRVVPVSVVMMDTRTEEYPEPRRFLCSRKCEGGHRGRDADTAPAVSLPVVAHCGTTRRRGPAVIDEPPTRLPEAGSA